MIQNKHLLEAFYRRLDANEKLSHSQALAIFEMLHKEAVSLGCLHAGNTVDGIEVAIKIANAVNKVAL
jgi:hypothetical protein